MILILSRVNNKLKKNGIRKVQKWGMMIFATLHDRLSSDASHSGGPGAYDINGIAAYGG